MENMTANLTTVAVDSRLKELFLSKVSKSFSLDLLKGSHPDYPVSICAVRVTSTAKEKDSMCFPYDEFMGSRRVEAQLNLLDECDARCLENLRSCAKQLRSNGLYETVDDLEIYLKGSLPSDKAEKYYELVMGYVRNGKFASKKLNDYKLSEHLGVWMDDPSSEKRYGEHVVAIENKFAREMFGASLTDNLTQVKRGLQDLGVLVTYSNNRSDFLYDINMNTIFTKKCLLFRVDRASL